MASHSHEVFRLREGIQLPCGHRMYHLGYLEEPAVTHCCSWIMNRKGVPTKYRSFVCEEHAKLFAARWGLQILMVAVVLCSACGSDDGASEPIARTEVLPSTGGSSTGGSSTGGSSTGGSSTGGSSTGGSSTGGVTASMTPSTGGSSTGGSNAAGSAGVVWSCGPVVQGPSTIGCSCIPGDSRAQHACEAHWTCCIATDDGCDCLNADCAPLAAKFAEVHGKVVSSCP